MPSSIVLLRLLLLRLGISVVVMMVLSGEVIMSNIVRCGCGGRVIMISMARIRIGHLRAGFMIATVLWWRWILFLVLWLLLTSSSGSCKLRRPVCRGRVKCVVHTVSCIGIVEGTNIVRVHNIHGRTVSGLVAVVVAVTADARR